MALMVTGFGRAQDQKVPERQKGGAWGQFTSYLWGEKINNEFSAEEEIESIVFFILPHINTVVWFYTLVQI